MLSTINVDYFGAPTPLQSLAAVSTPDAATLMVKPFDKTSLKVCCSHITYLLSVSIGAYISMLFQLYCSAFVF